MVESTLRGIRDKKTGKIVKLMAKTGEEEEIEITKYLRVVNYQRNINCEVDNLTMTVLVDKYTEEEE